MLCTMSPEVDAVCKATDELTPTLEAATKSIRALLRPSAKSTILTWLRLAALQDRVEPLYSRFVEYQREATATLDYLQHCASANPRVAAITHQWIYELQLPYAMCPGYELPVIDNLETFARGVTPGDFGLDARGMAPTWSPPR